jgi:hypothetical protein
MNSDSMKNGEKISAVGYRRFEWDGFRLRELMEYME